MAIHLRIKLENGISIDTVVDEKKQKNIENLKSYRVMVNEDNRRFRAYQKGEKLPPLDKNKRLFQLTSYINDLCNLDEKEIKLFKIF